MPENKNVFQKILNYYGINAPYILTVSQISPRKNLDTLINAFALLKKNPSFLHKLVIVGNNGWLYSSIYEIVKREGLANEVIFTGVIPDNDLIAIYNMADLFIFPSLYEGFGLPVLEAMSCGLPVICSNTSSLPEVVGNAGILFPPKDIYSLVNAVLGLLENPWLYKDLRERGLIKASEYSWEFTAKQIIKIFYDLRKYNHTATRH
ncbi:MAG: glycosyltransferase family 1 protein [Eubacteriaceae bacterium]